MSSSSVGYSWMVLLDLYSPQRDKGYEVFIPNSLEHNPHGRFGPREMCVVAVVVHMIVALITVVIVLTKV